MTTNQTELKCCCGLPYGHDYDHADIPHEQLMENRKHCPCHQPSSHLHKAVVEGQTEFDRKFPVFLSNVCPVDGKTVPIENGFWIFRQGHDKHNLPKEIKEFLASYTASILQAIERDVKEQLDNFFDYQLKSRPVDILGIGERGANEMLKGKTKVFLLAHLQAEREKLPNN